MKQFLWKPFSHSINQIKRQNGFIFEEKLNENNIQLLSAFVFTQNVWKR